MSKTLSPAEFAEVVRKAEAEERGLTNAERLMNPLLQRELAGAKARTLASAEDRVAKAERELESAKKELAKAKKENA